MFCREYLNVENPLVHVFPVRIVCVFPSDICVVFIKGDRFFVVVMLMSVPKQLQYIKPENPVGIITCWIASELGSQA